MRGKKAKTTAIQLIRAHTLGRLDAYLAQFADAVEAAGGRVHWAIDAEEANRIVLEIAQANGVKRVVKGKSMVTIHQPDHRPAPEG